MKKSRLLWIGCLESDVEFEIKSKKGYTLASAQVSQKNILSGIEEVTKSTFDSINGSVVPHYPIYEDKIIEPVIWNHKKNSFDISVGFKNIKFINRLTCKYEMIKAVRTWVKYRYNNEDELTVYVYSMRSAVMATACELKKYIPKAKIYLIITDLPQFMDLGESKIKAFLKKIDWLQIKRMQNKFDGFILYAGKMADYLNIHKDKWLLMEGVYNESEIKYIDSIEPSDKTKKAIMYSGKLDKEYGIELLVDSFMKINDEKLELWLTGGGNAEKYIKECMKKDFRIKFYGFLPSRNEVIKLQKQASILVNMRLPSEVASAYCFPSKLFEYMVTGIPVITFKLKGIPEEYYDYLCIIQEENEQGIINAINNVFMLSEKERKNIGFRARKFILDNKTNVKQAERIVEWSKSKKNFKS